MKLIVFTTILTVCTLAFAGVAWWITPKRRRSQNPWDVASLWKLNEPSHPIHVQPVAFYRIVRHAVRDLTPNSIAIRGESEPSFDDSMLTQALRSMRDPRRAQG